VLGNTRVCHQPGQAGRQAGRQAWRQTRGAACSCMYGWCVALLPSPALPARPPAPRLWLSVCCTSAGRGRHTRSSGSDRIGHLDRTRTVMVREGGREGGRARARGVGWSLRAGWLAGWRGVRHWLGASLATGTRSGAVPSNLWRGMHPLARACETCMGEARGREGKLGRHSSRMHYPLALARTRSRSRFHCRP
jgi:hypothetical protein